MLDSVKPLLAEHLELQTQLSDSSVHANPGLAKKLNRRYAELSAIVNAHSSVLALTEDLAAAKELAKEDDAFAEEVTSNELKLHDANEKLRRLLIPRDPDDGRDVIMEIKAGEGGAESALFAADLCVCTFNTPTPRVGKPRSSTRTNLILAASRMFRWLSSRTPPTQAKGFGRT